MLKICNAVIIQRVVCVREHIQYILYLWWVLHKRRGADETWARERKATGCVDNEANGGLILCLDEARCGAGGWSSFVLCAAFAAYHFNQVAYFSVGAILIQFTCLERRPYKRQCSPGWCVLKLVDSKSNRLERLSIYIYMTNAIHCSRRSLASTNSRIQQLMAW